MKSYQDVSTQIKTKASDFLDKYPIIDMLKKYGKTEIYGSYELDLMYRNDIDIALEVQNLNYEIVLEIQKELVNIGFNHFWIFDNRKGGSKEDPKCVICDAYIGYYDESIKPEDKWELGITICNKEESKRVLELTTTIKQKLSENPDFKNIIFKLKFELRKKYGERKFSSKQIYDAVLKDNVKTLEEFEEIN